MVQNGQQQQGEMHSIKPPSAVWSTTKTKAALYYYVNSSHLLLSKNNDDNDNDMKVENLAKNGLEFGANNFFSIVDAIIWGTLSVSILLYTLGYTFEIDRGFHVKVDTIERLRTEKQLEANYPVK